MRIFGLFALIHLLFTGCMQTGEKVALQQSFSSGFMIYQQKCQQCHGENGEGFRKLYPPLSNTAYLNDHFEQVPCIIKYGISGEMEVSGNKYDLPMTGFPEMTDYEVAQVMTYIYNAWDNDHGLITVEETRKLLRECSRYDH